MVSPRPSSCYGSEASATNTVDIIMIDPVCPSCPFSDPGGFSVEEVSLGSCLSGSTAAASGVSSSFGSKGQSRRVAGGIHCGLVCMCRHPRPPHHGTRQGTVVDHPSKGVERRLLVISKSSSGSAAPPDSSASWAGRVIVTSTSSSPIGVKVISSRALQVRCIRQWVILQQLHRRHDEGKNSPCQRPRRHFSPVGSTSYCFMNSKVSTETVSRSTFGPQTSTPLRKTTKHGNPLSPTIYTWRIVTLLYIPPFWFLVSDQCSIV